MPPFSMKEASSVADELTLPPQFKKSTASPGDTESFAFTGRSLDLLLNDRYCTIGIVHHFKTVAILGGPACLHEHASN